MEQLDRYDHLVHLNEETKELTIYRVEADGSRSLFTKIALPASQGWSDELASFARTLGENLLIDSPSARRVLGLDDDR